MRFPLVSFAGDSYYPGMALSRRWQEVKSATHAFFRRHWQRALIIRDWLRLSEEAFHLLLAAIVGIIGGLTYWIYYICNQ